MTYLQWLKKKASIVTLCLQIMSSDHVTQFCLTTEREPLGRAAIHYFLFVFSVDGFSMVWTARHPQWSCIINVALLASHFIFGPLSKVFLCIVFYDEGSVHAADVSAHAE